MTEPQTTLETPVVDPPADSADAGTDVAPDAATPERPIPRELRYRVERNQAREERDALAQRIEAMQTRELEHFAARHLAEPADLLTLSGRTLTDLLDEHGFVDPDLVQAAAAEVLNTRPGLRPNSPAYDRSQGFGGDTGRGTPTFSDLFQS